jgi:hypothetical protein
MQFAPVICCTVFALVVPLASQSPSALLRRYVAQPESKLVLVDSAPFLWELAREWHLDWQTSHLLRMKELDGLLARMRVRYAKGPAAVASQWRSNTVADRPAGPTRCK